ncbi:MAG: 3'(2'),5'-bisphosphate nucleotidase CysQ [Lachnospiraceae bacterium]|nr:3'(2'),5'-bisphosphate nucleotidase CysQ [Lachnospiraceae bacterium]
MWEQELKVSIKAAVLAGRAILDIYENADDIEIEKKGDGSPLTKADRRSNGIIVKHLKNAFPDHAILSEEEKDDKSRLSNPLCFVVDPLDGTKEFIKRNGQFTVNIALAHEHRTVMGVIYVPVTGDLYYGSQDNGSFLAKVSELRNGEDIDMSEPVKLHVSDVTGTQNLRVVASSSHLAPQMEEMIKKYDLKNLVMMGSSLKGCLVAKGDADIYFRHNPTMEWDTAAMQAIAEAAGAIFCQMDDTPMLYNRENSLNDKGFYVINRPENRLR